MFGVGGLLLAIWCNLGTLLQQSLRPQCLPLHNTEGGGAGQRPEGRKHATPMPCRKKERILAQAVSGSRPPRRESPTLWSRAALFCLFDPGARGAKPGRLTPLSPSSDAIAGLFDRWLCSEPAARSCLGTSCARLPVGDRCCVVPWGGPTAPLRGWASLLSSYDIKIRVGGRP